MFDCVICPIVLIWGGVRPRGKTRSFAIGFVLFWEQSMAQKLRISPSGAVEQWGKCSTIERVHCRLLPSFSTALDYLPL